MSKTLKFLSKEERAKLSDADFAYVDGNKRLFPIISEDDISHSLEALENLNLNQEEKDKIKSNIENISKKKFKFKSDFSEIVENFNLDGEQVSIEINHEGKKYLFNLVEIS